MAMGQGKNLTIRYVPLDECGALDLGLLLNKTCMVAFTHVSNVLGTINPVETMTTWRCWRKVLIDGAQACPQIAVDVAEQIASNMGLDENTAFNNELFYRHQCVSRQGHLQLRDHCLGCSMTIYKDWTLMR